MSRAASVVRQYSRLIPGDRVQMIDGVLFINGEPVRRERIESFVDQSLGGSQEFTRWRETLPNGVIYQTLKSPPNLGTTIGPVQDA